MPRELANSMTDLDPVTLATVNGTLDASIREMTVTIRRTAMSAVLAIGNDFSNAIFDDQAQMVLQGQDQPVHLGAMIFACRQVLDYFGSDLTPGDVIYHNDPPTGGSHMQDMTLFKPLFYEGELVFWTANRSHMSETGGPVAGGYNPLAEEIWAEGVRIPPVKLYEKGKARRDVIDLLLANLRTRRQFSGDLRAQLAACSVAERRLTRLLQKYGIDVVKSCLAALLDRAESLMRTEIRNMPDGRYIGRAMVEGIPPRSTDMEIQAVVDVSGDRLHVALQAPRQTRTYANSYAANTISGIYLGVITYVDPDIPHNSGIYRPLTIDLGPKGTIVNAEEPAACSLATSTPNDSIVEAVRDALAQARPDRAGGGWSKVAQLCFAGVDPRNGQPYAYLSHMTGWGGGGAFWGQDGEPAVGPILVAGAATTGDIELVEHWLPLHVHRYELLPDSACPGRWRGGWGPYIEVEPVDHTTQVSFLGEGFKYPPRSVLGATSPRNETRVFTTHVRAEGAEKRIPTHSILPVTPGEVVRQCCPGGGGVGPAMERSIDAVLQDWRSGLLSIDSARDEYGVVIDPRTAEVDLVSTTSRRAQPRPALNED